MSEAIHGVTFEDWGAVNARLVQQEKLEDLLPVLGIEMPQWEEANDHWLKALENDSDHTLAIKYGEIFQNPNVGKFAGGGSATSDDAAEKIPDLESYLDIMMLVQVAEKYGVDTQAAMAEQGLTLMDFSQAGMKYMPQMHTPPDGHDERAWNHHTSDVMKAAEAKYEAQFSAQAGPKIGDDIEF